MTSVTKLPVLVATQNQHIFCVISKCLLGRRKSHIWTPRPRHGASPIYEWYGKPVHQMAAMVHHYFGVPGRYGTPLLWCTGPIWYTIALVYRAAMVHHYFCVPRRNDTPLLWCTGPLCYTITLGHRADMTSLFAARPYTITLVYRAVMTSYGITL